MLNAAILVDALVEQGELEAAERALAPMDETPESGSLTAVMLRFARGRLRIAQGRTAEGLEDLLAAGAVTTRALVTCPSFLPWRSYAAMAQLALGDGDAARRLADEELGPGPRLRRPPLPRHRPAAPPASPAAATPGRGAAARRAGDAGATDARSTARAR